MIIFYIVSITGAATLASAVMKLIDRFEHSN